MELRLEDRGELTTKSMLGVRVLRRRMIELGMEVGRGGPRVQFECLKSRSVGSCQQL